MCLHFPISLHINSSFIFKFGYERYAKHEIGHKCFDFNLLEWLLQWGSTLLMGGHDVYLEFESEANNVRVRQRNHSNLIEENQESDY